MFRKKILTQDNYLEIYFFLIYNVGLVYNHAVFFNCFAMFIILIVSAESYYFENALIEAIQITLFIILISVE